MGKKTEKKAEAAQATDINTCMVSGSVLRAKQTEKVCRFTLDCAQETQNGKVAHSYVPVVWFNADSEDTVSDGERINVKGSLRSGSYEKDGRKIYTLDLVAEEIIFSE